MSAPNADSVPTSTDHPRHRCPVCGALNSCGDTDETCIFGRAVPVRCVACMDAIAFHDPPQIDGSGATS